MAAGPQALIAPALPLRFSLKSEAMAAGRARTGINIALWLIQGLLAIFFVYAAYIKLATPVEELARMMPWAAQLSSLVPVTGIADLLGGLGILLPTLTRIRPRLTVLAALGLLVLQGLALGFHAVRGEMAVLPMNVVLILLIAVVLWGRTRAVPVTGR